MGGRCGHLYGGEGGAPFGAVSEMKSPGNRQGVVSASCGLFKRMWRCLVFFLIPLQKNKTKQNIPAPSSPSFPTAETVPATSVCSFALSHNEAVPGGRGLLMPPFDPEFFGVTGGWGWGEWNKDEGGAGMIIDDDGNN